MIITKWW